MISCFLLEGFSFFCFFWVTFVSLAGSICQKIEWCCENGKTDRDEKWLKKKRWFPWSNEIRRNYWRLRSAVANTIAWHAIDPEFNPRRSHFFTFCFFLHYSQYQLFLLFNNTNNWQTLWSIVSFYFNLVICHFSSNYSISVIKRSPILILCGRRTVTVLLFPNHQRETLSKCKEKASRRICNLWLSNQNGLRVPSFSKKKRIPV